MTKLRLPRGVRDILPAEAARWRQLETAFVDCCEPAGYGELRTPMFEDLEVFKRLGEQTEVVTKEMYDFIDKGGNHIALRPEMTASAARAFMQHNPPVPWKIYYLGPQFRYERPQAGRYRQFSQAGIEVFGVSDPHLDVEVMALGWQFLQALGLRRLTLLVNSLGDAAGRERYGEQLSQYWQARHGELSEASQATAQTNPLRVLDSKRPEDQAVIAEAPSCLDALSEADAERFEVVRAGLDVLEIPCQVTPRLVRGLDYYTQTAFEYVSDALEGAQNALGGGGHYGGLVQVMGGGAVPGVGFAMGIDRILLACDTEEVFDLPAGALDVFVVDIVGGGEALAITQELRAGGISCDRAWSGRSLKAQMKQADRSGARFAVIVGPDEQAASAVALRDLHSQDFSAQASIPRSELPAVLQAKLAEAS